MIFKAPAIVHHLKTMGDNSLRAQVDFQEMPTLEEIKLLSLRNKLAWVLISEQEFTEKDLEDLPELTLEKDEKSPSQILRNRLFVYHKEAKVQEEFNPWYRRQLDRFGQQFLDKLR